VAFARASAGTQALCLICPEMLAQLRPQLAVVVSWRSSAVQSRPQPRRPSLSEHLRGHFVPEQSHSKYIAPHRGGFLQVVVSEAPHPRSSDCASLCRGRSRYNTRT
jgi:hypothetical protein